MQYIHPTDYYSPIKRIKYRDMLQHLVTGARPKGSGPVREHSSRQIHTGGRTSGAVETGVGLFATIGLLFGVMRMFCDQIVVHVHNLGNILRSTELYSLKQSILWTVNDSSTFFLIKKMKSQAID